MAEFLNCSARRPHSRHFSRTVEDSGHPGGPDLDVVVVGDGPAGLALAAACRRVGLAVLVIGEGRTWTPTYGMWRDEVDLPDRCFHHIVARTVVEGRSHHEIERPYAIVDNEALRAHLAGGVDVRIGRATGVQHLAWGSRVLTDTGSVDTRMVVEATGRPYSESAAQSAFGIVVAEPPPGFDRHAVTLMDLRPLPGASGPPTFCYVVPVADGWLVEETVLAARPPVPAELLRARLEVRIGPDGAAVIADARRVERVVVPLGGAPPDRGRPVVAFGAAAGYTHPATGFSVAASLRAAPRVATAIAERRDLRHVWEAVWPSTARRTRRLHDYGLEVLLGLDAAELAMFFDAFFDLPEATWAPYLRIDARPREISRTMTGVLRRLPWAVRRRLVVNPLGGS